MSKKVTSHESRVTPKNRPSAFGGRTLTGQARKARYPFFDESRDFIAPRYTRDWAILNEVKNLANRFKRPATRNPQPATSRGFTLLELMIVVVIIGITIGGVLFVAAGSYRKTSVRNAARDVASLMRMAHSKALSERVYYNVVLSSGNCYLEKHYSGTTAGSIWEDIPASSADETDDNYFEIDTSPGAKKKLANVVDIDDGTGTTLGLRKIAFTLKETVMGITPDDVMINATWTQSDIYSVFLDDNDSGTGNVRYLVTVDSDTARVKIYSSW